ncbi:uncharacterized protein LOC128550641 [Mercenaria mercenaria]|uniref:uncharacterized protein LOC128550641 n=1 Tax=Mercenaria mercenaria TaxID=6596 RepID=UPI00234E5873|nr:uncharacterized protein LOC128550641 [Mercenaria mercenaria]
MTLIATSICLLLLGGGILVQGIEEVDYNNPILPEVFQSVIGQGFAVKYFTQITKKPIEKYNESNIQDVYDAGFRNVRLRCTASFYPYPYNSTNFTTLFLDNLEKVVDKCLEVGVAPIISWANVPAQNYATQEDEDNFVTWWTKVAERLKQKDFRLAFNLMTEIGNAFCGKQDDCDINGTIKENITKYYSWTSRAKEAIRNTTKNNKRRILILSSPKKSAWGLDLIPKELYKRDRYLMVEHHHYASGPNKKPDSGKYWTGNGTEEQRKMLVEELTFASNFALKNYFGAWAPLDIKKGTLLQHEVESFAKFFVSTLRNFSVPWSLNALDMYYDTKSATWLTEYQEEKGLNMAPVLDVIKQYM